MTPSIRVLTSRCVCVKKNMDAITFRVIFYAYGPYTHAFVIYLQEFPNNRFKFCHLFMMIESNTFDKKIYYQPPKQMKAIAECKPFLVNVSSQTFSGNKNTTIAKVATIYWLFDTLYMNY